MAGKRLDKVAAFITRPAAQGGQLLLVRHPDSGLQVPAGTVEVGESVEAAVLREAAEETGLRKLETVRPLVHFPEDLPAGQYLILRMTKIFSEPAYDASSEGYGLTRGSPVLVKEYVGDFAAVLTDPLDHSQEPARRVSGVSGYVRRSLLTRQVTRHLFHLSCGEETDEQWSVFTDGIMFEAQWRPLATDMDLNPYQAAWLAEVYENIREAV